jgi:hypothetical protein
LRVIRHRIRRVARIWRLGGLFLHHCGAKHHGDRGAHVKRWADDSVPLIVGEAREAISRVYRGVASAPFSFFLIV